ncbi:hypothetical protein ACP4OV_008642 [Aristida adscensionis]
MVPYPFGIEPGCYLQSFGLICDNTNYTPPQLFFGPRNTSQTQIVHVTSNALRENETRAGNATCPKDLGSTTCHSSYSICQASSRHSDGYRSMIGYTWFPRQRVHPRWMPNINECTLPDKCFGDCKNLHGTYLCQCPKGTVGNPNIPNGCITHHSYSGVGSGALLLFLGLGITLLIGKVKSQRKKKLRQRFFKQNRGQLLQQLVCQRANIAERMIISLEELEKATNNFDISRKLGGGGHGTVYKGILSSLHVVAIKESNIVIQKEIDDFINEVAILSQINHRNIVKLLGCCLETEVPLLVYGFISNVTLYNHLHVEALV